MQNISEKLIMMMRLEIESKRCVCVGVLCGVRWAFSLG